MHNLTQRPTYIHSIYNIHAPRSTYLIRIIVCKTVYAMIVEENLIYFK
jgi:hypothetical protein